MKLFFRKRYAALLILVLAAILAALGRMQYLSTQQVTDATARDMEESLQSDLFDFRHLLEREITSLCVELQPSGDSAAATREIAQRYALWAQTATHASLVNEILLWDGSRDVLGNGPLLLTKGEGFKSAPWPSSLSGLPAELEHFFPEPNTNPSFPPPSHAGGMPTDRGAPRFGWMIDQERLALLHPMLEMQNSGKPRAEWLIIVLDRKFLSQHLLPELARSQFGGRGGSYQVAVIFGQDPPRVLYASQPGFGSTSNSAADASLNLFGPPGLVREKTASHVTGVVIPVSTESGDPRQLFIDPFLPSPPGPALAVIAQHRRGSLEAAVSALRKRNLTLNFAVLGILALTLVIVVFTSQRARTLGQMQMDFVAGVSHELRTPLTAIILAARNLEDGVVRPEALARYGVAIKSQAAQLAELVDEILLFSETHSGRHEYKIEPVDVALAIQITIENLAPLIQANGFRIEENIGADLPLVRADAAALTQCLQNLISNSLKYGGEEKWVGIRAFSAMNQGAREICISVEDRGIGISSGELKQIFEPFYRSPKVASEIHGNGLGLALTRTMVEAMGGELTVSSELGKGSSFTVHLRPA